MAGYGLCVFEIFSISIRGLKIFQVTLLPEASSTSSSRDSESVAGFGLHLDLGDSGVSVSLEGMEGMESMEGMEGMEGHESGGLGRGDSLMRESLMQSGKIMSVIRPKDLELGAQSFKSENTVK